MQLIPKSEYDFHAVKRTSLNEIPYDVTKAYFDASTVAPSGRGFKGQAKKIGLSIKQYLKTDWTLGVYGLKVSECYVGYYENFRQISDSDSLLYKSDPKFFLVNREDEPTSDYDDSRYGHASFHATISFLDYPIIGLDEKVIRIYEYGGNYNAHFNFTKNNEVLRHTKPCKVVIEKTTYDENDLPVTEQIEKPFTVLITGRISAQVIYPDFDIYTYDIDPALGTVTESGEVKNKVNWVLDFADWSTGNFYFNSSLNGVGYCRITIDQSFKVIQKIFSYDYIDYLGAAGFIPETTAYDFDSKTGQLPKKMLIDNFIGENTIYEIEGFPKSWPMSRNTISGSDEARVFIWSGADPLTIYAVLRDGRGYTKILLPDELKGKTLKSFIVRGSELLVFYTDYVKQYVASFYFAIYIEGDTITQDLSLTGFNRLLCYSPQLQKGGIITKVK